MIWGDALIAFLLALLSIVILAFVLGLDRWMVGRGTGAGVFAIFTLLFLAIWAGGAWLGPGGPQFWGVAWVPFVIVAFLLAMLLAALAGTSTGRTGPPAVDPNSQVASAASSIVLGAFFWLLLVALAAVILLAYVT